MEDFEKQMAEKIKQQLENGELDDVTEDQPHIEVVEDPTQVLEETPQNDTVVDEKDDKKKSSFIANTLGAIERKTNHFDRKEKVRPLAVVVAILSSILCLGLLALAVFCVIKLIPFAWDIISKIINLFFSQNALAVSIGFSVIPGGILVILIGGLFIALILAATTIGMLFLNFPIVAIKTAKLPKQVFALETDSGVNMILGYVFGAIVTFLGVAMYMDGSLGYSPYFVLAGGAILLIVAILLTIDLTQCKKVYNNLQNEQEKQEIKEESNAIRRQKQLKRKNKKLVTKVLEKIFKKKR